MFKKVIFIFFIAPLFIKGQGIITGDTVSASIIYINIKDSILPIAPNGTIAADFDLDGDNVKDVKFKITQSYGVSYTNEVQQVFPLNNFELITLVTPAGGYLDSMPLGSNINNSLNWWTTPGAALCLFSYYYATGNTTINGIFKNASGYLGFRKILPNDTIYGWILLDAHLFNGIKIRSWAYEKKCNTFPGLAVVSSSSVVCSLESVTLSASGATSYTWSTGSNNSSITITPTVTTTYTVDGTNAVGCLKSSVITQTVSACIGIIEIKDHPLLRTYPNPVNEVLNISTSNGEFEKSEIEITNTLGQTILKEKFKTEIDVSKLPPGFYYLKIISENKQIYYSKFIKE